MPVHAEEATAKATAARQAHGHFFQAKEQQALFVGVFSMRSDVVDYATTLQGDSVEAAAAGVAEWPAFKYKLP